MKFIHLADVHLGAAVGSNEEASEARQLQAWDTFVSTVEDAGNEGVDLLLIAGDLFDVPPALEDLQEINALFSRIPQVRVVMIAGDHDYISQGSGWQQMRWSRNVAVMMSRSCECVRFPEIDTDVYGMSYYSQTLPERACSSLAPIDKHKTNILLVHGGDESHIPMNDRELAKSGFDYIALGHIHKPTALIPRLAIYPGSLEPLSEEETGKHGYILGEAKGHRLKLEFVPKAKLRYSKKKQVMEETEHPSAGQQMAEHTVPDLYDEAQVQAQRAEAERRAAEIAEAQRAEAERRVAEATARQEAQRRASEAAAQAEAQRAYEQQDEERSVRAARAASVRASAERMVATASTLRIVSLEPLAFGRFSGQTMKMRPGINVIYGGNETGKSTLHAFVRAMLYGITARGGRKGRDEYSLREPWNIEDEETGGAYGGAMTVNLDGDEFRIERSFRKNHKSVTMTRVADGRPVNLDGHEPGELLTGLGESEFMSTIWMPQGAENGFDQLEDLAGPYLEETEGTTDESADTNPAELLHELMQQRANAQERVRMAEFSVRTAEAARLQQKRKNRRGRGLKGSLMDYILLAWAVLCGLIAIIFAFSVVLSEGVGSRLLFMLLTIVFAAAGILLFNIWKGGSLGADKIRVSEDMAEDETYDMAGYDYIESFKAELAAIERQIRILQEGEAYKAFEEKQAFNSQLSDLMTAFTQGRYDGAVRDAEGSVRILAEGTPVYPQMLGAGTSAQINLALRMTAADQLTGRALPLVLDEAFVFYDNEALEDALGYLERSGRQVILFTGNTREKQILDKIRSK